ncbi:hypothetical protein ebA6447 [Aromatoleum aromaticum EbN1]|uniref:Uncharacterized protein n=1 Tax=Aromatoleum aromaticum (strain DSM 19018 / LMG 30748 / EbN1) TaxID=76114 RepID=Q5NYQ3_AROAE|nr:hypothetical protein ebA6447 [Aromatoleum aromaticum EbN1]
MRWRRRGSAVPNAEEKAVLYNNGIWEAVSRTGKLKGLQGAGMLHVKQVCRTALNFILEGALASNSRCVRRLVVDRRVR